MRKFTEKEIQENKIWERAGTKVISGELSNGIMVVRVEKYERLKDKPIESYQVFYKKYMLWKSWIGRFFDKLFHLSIKVKLKGEELEDLLWKVVGIVKEENPCWEELTEEEQQKKLQIKWIKELRKLEEVE